MMLTKKRVWFALLAMTIAAGGGYYYWYKKSNDGAITYLTEKVVRGNIVRQVVASGSVDAVNLVSVGAQVSGQIKKLYVKLGQQVKKDDLIAEIDSVTQINALNTDKAILRTYESSLDAKKATYDIAKTRFERESQLWQKNATSKESYEDAKQTQELTKAEMVEVESQITQTKIKLSTDEQNLSYTRITAPLDGTVVSVPVSEGQTVNANQNTPTIVQVADLKKMEIQIEISEGDISQVQPGMPVNYTILSMPDVEFHAQVDSLDPGMTTLSDGDYDTSSSSSSSSSNSTTSAVYFYGKAIVDNEEGHLRIGMTTQNVITTDKKENVLLVPITAVHFDNEGKKSVRVLTPTGELQKTQVTTGISDGVHMQVLSGVKEGDELSLGQVSEQEIQDQSKAKGPGMRRMR